MPSSRLDPTQYRRWSDSRLARRLERVIVALVVHQCQNEPITLDGRRSRPVHLVHFVHALEAEHDRAVGPLSTINVASLQPDLEVAADAIALSTQRHIGCPLHMQVALVEVRARPDRPRTDDAHRRPLLDWPGNRLQD